MPGLPSSTSRAVVVHEPLALGVDFGTSAVKAVAMTEHGQVEAEASADYPTDRPGPNRAEQAPDDWWRALVTVCRSILSAVDGRRLVGIGLSGQLNGIVLVDAQGRVLLVEHAACVLQIPYPQTGQAELQRLCVVKVR